MVEVNKPVEVSDGGGGESAATVSVLCYNLLAQDLIRKNLYLYSDAVPELLEWDFRKTNLLKDLTDSDADVGHEKSIFLTTLCIPVFLPWTTCGLLETILTFCVDQEWAV